MAYAGNEATHLKSVMFEIHYPPSPYLPNAPVLAPFSGVLNADGRIHAKLDSGSIPTSPSTPGIRIRGYFTVDSGEGRQRFVGYLCNDRITADAQS